MDGAWGVLAWVILGPDFAPIQFLAAKKKPLMAALLKHMIAKQGPGPTPAVHGPRTIEYALMASLQPNLVASKPMTNGPLP